MVDYQKRMIEERKELSERIARAKEYLAKFEGQELDEKTTMLNAQYYAMKAYEFILSQRILLELNEGSLTLEEVNGGK